VPFFKGFERRWPPRRGIVSKLKRMIIISRRQAADADGRVVADCWRAGAEDSSRSRPAMRPAMKPVMRPAMKPVMKRQMTVRATPRFPCVK
jgi:hypothetical protein